MEYRELGKTGISVSVVSFGCGEKSRLMIEDDEELQIATVRRAVEHGINYFDTAFSYGDGRSERNLRRALDVVGADPVISTKIVLTEDDLVDPRSSILRLFEGNLDRLGRERLDALLIHNRVTGDTPETAYSGDFGPAVLLSPRTLFASNGVAEALQELITAGRVRTVGFSAYGGSIPAMGEVIDSGVFGVMNIVFNLLNPSAVVRVPPTFHDVDFGAVAPRAAAAGLGVMAFKVLGTGALTGSGPQGGRAAAVAAAALASGAPLAQVATNYAISKPEISTALIGFSTPQHVDDAVRAVADAMPDAAQLLALEELSLQLDVTTGEGNRPDWAG